ncbi:MAG TPA: ATP-binding protein, partial [Methanobacterium sp.]|nr:ATP-binding protein [Methanobacterium sp.]
FRKEEVNPEIHISSQKTDDGYIFSVADNGIGMEEQHTKKIFEPFRRLHTIDVYEGTGIGLAIVNKIIEHHGGQIWFESEFGKGSTFYFIIPVESVETRGGEFLKYREF